MTAELKVSASELTKKADAIEDIGTNINTSTKAMLDIIAGINSAWKGDAATAFANAFNQLDNDMNKMQTMITEHVSDLRAIATNYIDAENANQEAISSLATDILV